MKRNMELIRKILLAVESGELNESIEGYSDDEIKYHKVLAIDAGLLEGKVLNSISNRSDIPVNVFINRITWEGHDFVEGIASESNWGKVKSFLLDGGKQVTIDTIKAAVVILFGLSTS